MLASSITSFGGVPFTPTIAPETVEVKEIVQVEDKKVAAKENLTAEEYVRHYFSDIPVMIEIARCESRFRQHDRDGEVLRGEKNNLDRGVMQINEYFHNENSEKLGYDILTIEGNTAYARYLFEKYGLKPWVSSARCWGKTAAFTAHIDGLAMK